MSPGKGREDKGLKLAKILKSEEVVVLKLKKQRLVIAFLLVTLVICIIPTIAVAEETQTVNYHKDISQERKDFYETIIQMKENSNCYEDYLSGLRDLGATEQEITTSKYAVVDDENGEKTLVLLETKTVTGEEYTESDITTMGGLKSDLTLTFTKTKWDDGLPVIWI